MFRNYFCFSHNPILLSLVSLEVKILYASKVTWLFSLRIIMEFKDGKLLLSSLCGIDLFFCLKPRDIITILSHYFVSGLKSKCVYFRNLLISIFLNATRYLPPKLYCRSRAAAIRDAALGGTVNSLASIFPLKN